MFRVFSLLFLVVVSVSLAACSSNDKIDKGIKSPCVSAPSGVLPAQPCGPRRSVNRWLS